MRNGSQKVWIRSWKTKKGTCYALQWRDGELKRQERIGRVSKQYAEQQRRLKEYELATGAESSGPERISYEDFVTEHLKMSRAQKAPRTVEVEEAVLERFRETAKPQWLEDVDHRMVDRYIEIRRHRDEISAATANKEIRTLRSVLESAKKRGYLESNPLAELKQLREPEKPMRILSSEEVEKLLAAAPSLRWRCFIYIAAGCGLRLSELIHLRWKDADLEVGVISVENRDGWSTKSRKNRIVGVSRRGIEMLQALKRKSGRKSEYVFCTEDGSRVRNNIHRMFRNAVKRAKIESCTLHDLRRTFCTRVCNEVGLKEAQEAAGHASPMTTLRHYIGAQAVSRAREIADKLGY